MLPIRRITKPPTTDRPPTTAHRPTDRCSTDPPTTDPPTHQLPTTDTPTGPPPTHRSPTQRPYYNWPRTLWLANLILTESPVDQFFQQLILIHHSQWVPFIAEIIYKMIDKRTFINYKFCLSFHLETDISE